MRAVTHLQTVNGPVVLEEAPRELLLTTIHELAYQLSQARCPTVARQMVERVMVPGPPYWEVPGRLMERRPPPLPTARGVVFYAVDDQGAWWAVSAETHAWERCDAPQVAPPRLPVPSERPSFVERVVAWLQARERRA